MRHDLDDIQRALDRARATEAEDLLGLGALRSVCLTNGRTTPQGRAIIQALHENGMRNRDIAALTGLTPGAISQQINGYLILKKAV